MRIHVGAKEQGHLANQTQQTIHQPPHGQPTAQKRAKGSCRKANEHADKPTHQGPTHHPHRPEEPNPTGMGHQVVHQPNRSTHTKDPAAVHHKSSKR
jgi:hypothetical protein